MTSAFEPTTLYDPAWERHPRMVGADLRRANLTRADMSGGDLSDANLRRATFAEAYLDRAVLVRADLTGAELTGAHLRGADLSGAIMELACLRHADLRGADLTGADLTGADVTGALYDRATRWPDGYDPAAGRNVDPLYLLNGYTGDNIWQDVILLLGDYDEAASDAIDEGKSDRFVAAGRMYRYDGQTRQWYEARQP